MTVSWGPLLLVAGELPSLVPWPERPAWMADGACRGHETGEFFPERGQSLVPAREACAGCPVTGPCLQWALDHDEAGIWGGTTDRERAKLRRRAA